MSIFKDLWKYECKVTKRSFESFVSILYSTMGICSIIGGGVLFVLLFYYSDKQGIMDYALGVISFSIAFIVVYSISRAIVPANLDKENKQTIISFKEKISFLEKEIKELKTPLLEIEHDENDEINYHYSSIDLPIPLKKLLDEHPTLEQVWRLCRIAIHNLSPVKTIKNIEVKLIDIEPESLRGKPELHLQFTHNKEEPLLQSIDLNPGARQFVDIVQYIYLNGRSPFYMITTSEKHVNTEISLMMDSHYKTIIEVTAENTPKISKGFYFGLIAKGNKDKKLWMWSAND